MMKSMGNGHQVLQKLLSAKDLERFKLNFVVSLPLLEAEYEDEDYQEDTDDTGSEEAEVVVASDFLESAFGLYNIAQKKLISDQTCLEAIRLATKLAQTGAARLAQAGEVKKLFAEDDDEYIFFFPQELVQVEVPGNPDDEKAYIEASKEAVISVLEKAPKNKYPTVYFYLEKDDDQPEELRSGDFIETFLDWLRGFGDRELMYFDHESAHVSGKVKVLSFDWERKSLVLNYAIEVSVKRKHEISMHRAMAIARRAGLLESEEEESEEERYVPRVAQVSRHGKVDTILEVKLGDEWDYRVEDDEDTESRYVRLSLPCTPLSASIIASSWGKLEITLVPVNQGQGERVLRVEVEGGEWIQAGNPKTEVHKLVKENVEEAKPPTLSGLVSALNQLREGVLGKTLRGLFGDGIEDIPLLSGRALLREILHMTPLCLEGREVWAIAEEESPAGRNERKKVPSLSETFSETFKEALQVDRGLYWWEEWSIISAISQFLRLYVDETLSAAETELGPKEYIVRPKESEVKGIGKFFKGRSKLYGVELVLGVDRDEGSVEKVVVSDQQSGDKREVQLVKRVIFGAG